MAATPKKADVGEAIPGLGSLPLEKVEYKRPLGSRLECWE
jgi:hypothetical protein